MTPARAIEQACDALVADLVRRRIIRTPAVEAAFGSVPRHRYLPTPFTVAIDPLGTEFEESSDPPRAYQDALVLLKRDPPAVCAAPSVVAEQIEQLAVSDGMRVLHIGAGSAYATAILANLAGETGSVVAVEHDAALAELGAARIAQHSLTTVTIRAGDGALGVPEAAPFDRILVSGGVTDIAPAWVEQLDHDGRLVLPLCQPAPPGACVGGGALLAVHKLGRDLFGRISTVAFFSGLGGTFAPTEADGGTLADGLMRWFALEDFLRTEPPIRITMKGAGTHTPDPRSVPWLLETRRAVLWVEPN